jgi:hypothetical protein
LQAIRLQRKGSSVPSDLVSIGATVAAVVAILALAAIVWARRH